MIYGLEIWTNMWYHKLKYTAEEMGTLMNWLEGLFYGLVSGLSDFMPISSKAHQMLLINLFGLDSRDLIYDLLVHIALLLAVYTECQSVLLYIHRERNARGNNRYRNMTGMHFDSRLVKHAAVPLLIGLFLYPFLYKTEQNLLLLSFFLILNGVILFIPGRILNGNKNARAMTLLDSTLIGLGGALSVFTGISRIGAMTSVGIMRGAEKQHALHWALLLSIPSILFLAGFDVIQLFLRGAAFRTAAIPGYILASFGAYLGGCIGIKLMKYLTIRVGFSMFAYYSWGAALFSFILYLLV